jgi:tetratricopeptide (TPR) repeat protein
MKRWLVVLLSLLVAACATAPPSPQSRTLFNDNLFGAPSENIDASDVFALSPAMREFVAAEIANRLHVGGRREGLVDALRSKAGLHLEYDAAITRNAAQAFAARAGNCLSLVIMTAAFAKELGLAVRYQDVIVDEMWSRTGDVYMSIGHVNLSLAPQSSSVGLGRRENAPMTIDFLPPREAAAARARVIGEDTVIAMYMNNRAVEALTRNRLDDAYWWAREAIRQNPRFLPAYNTLGAVFWRHGNAAEAAQVFADILEREPANLQAMSNLVPALNALGRTADAREVAAKLARMEPDPPFSYFDRGVAAMQRGDYKAAKELFAKEVSRATYYHEFHFWLAIACLRLGEIDEARRHLAIAMDTSTTRDDHDVYAAKLAATKVSRAHQIGRGRINVQSGFE